MNVAFLANSFHLTRTKSADFFIEMLRAFFGEVAVIPSKEAWAQLPGRKWDLIVVFQKQYPPEELEAFGARNVVLVPMYDDCPHDEAFWARYRNFKVFCFSSTHQTLLTSYGVEAWGARYFPEIPERSATFASGNGLRGFFWPRVKSIDWNLVKTLMGETCFSHMQLHWTPEIHSDLKPVISDADRSNGKISISAWSGDRRKYMDLLLESNVFFAPRTLEGIGMSFIEAMSMGLCVVAPRAPTMSEYIEDGVTGLLYDPENVKALDFSHAREIGAAARASCEAGRERWLSSWPAIKAFLEEPAAGYRIRHHPGIALRGRSISAARRVFRLMKRLLKRAA